MPYASNADLPPSIRRSLPPRTQDIFRSAFNAAWDHYDERKPARRDEIAHHVAWAAVKKRYAKVGGVWQANGGPSAAKGHP